MQFAKIPKKAIIRTINVGLTIKTSNTIIENNEIHDNWGGIYFDYPNNNQITNNNIYDNWNSIHLDGSKIYLNNFINNTKQAYDNGNNYWNSTDRGNYWFDYKGEDNNVDGIGDTPYSILGGNPPSSEITQPIEKKEEKQNLIYIIIIRMIIISIAILTIFLMKKKGNTNKNEQKNQKKWNYELHSYLHIQF